jgi:hypothetical protein
MVKTDKYLFFWKEHPFCNFTKCKIKVEYPDSQKGEELWFTSSEQLFMWYKAKYFRDDETAEKILAAKSPEEARQLGRQVKHYIDWQWDDNRYFYMHKAVMSKFIQNKNLRDQLLDPKYDGIQFVEAAYYDRIWGIGFNEADAVLTPEKEWGKNLLGKILNEVRNWCIDHKDILDFVENQ